MCVHMQADEVSKTFKEAVAKKTFKEAPGKSEVPGEDIKGRLHSPFGAVKDLISFAP